MPMLRNASNDQLLELASLLTKNVPKHIDEETAKAWLNNPDTLRDDLHKMLLKGSMSRMTGFYFEGPNSFITQGETALLLPSDGWLITAKLVRESRGVFVRVEHPGISDGWHLTMIAPNSPMAIGEYRNAARYEKKGWPALEFCGRHRANNNLVGDFIVLEFELRDGKIDSFAADFTQYDECQALRRTRGSIRYNSQIPQAVFGD
jgi:hypothetical protein